MIVCVVLLQSAHPTLDKAIPAREAQTFLVSSLTGTGFANVHRPELSDEKEASREVIRNQTSQQDIRKTASSTVLISVAKTRPTPTKVQKETS